MRALHRSALFVILLILTSVPPVAAQAPAPADLLQVIRERDQAVDRADADTWDRLTADDFSVVQEDGRLLTRVERLPEIRKTKPASSLMPCQQERLQVLGDTAIERCRFEDIRIMQVWVRAASGWHVAATQVTRVTAK